MSDSVDNSTSAIETTSPASTERPKSIDGKRLTIGVLILMVMLGGTLVFALSSFSVIDAARSQKKAAWAELREQIDRRYRAIEKVVAQGVDERRIPMEWGEKFRLNLDAFRTTAQVAEQHNQARAIEELLTSADFTLTLPAVDDSLEQSIGQLQDATEAENAALSSLGGRLLGVFFRFEHPSPLILAQ